MGMDRADDRLEELFELARQSKYDTGRIEYGFETRVMARIKEQGAGQTLFFSWALKLMPALIVVVIMISAWAHMEDSGQLLVLNLDTAGNSEETMLAASLTGE